MMTDEQFYQRQREINESYRRLTGEELAKYMNEAMRPATPEEIGRVFGPMLQNDPYAVKLNEMEERFNEMEERKRLGDRFFTWCQGARAWDE